MYACALLSLLAERGLRPAAFKPYETGCEDLEAPADAIALGQAARRQDAAGPPGQAPPPGAAVAALAPEP